MRRRFEKFALIWCEVSSVMRSHSAALRLSGATLSERSALACTSQRANGSVEAHAAWVAPVSLASVGGMPVDPCAELSAKSSEPHSESECDAGDVYADDVAELGAEVATEGEDDADATSVSLLTRALTSPTVRAARSPTSMTVMRVCLRSFMACIHFKSRGSSGLWLATLIGLLGSGRGRYFAGSAVALRRIKVWIDARWCS